jgi:uncharacterized protein (TIGR02594 family)
LSEPLWLAEARRHIGLRELAGSAHEPKILAWWRAIRRSGIKDDETPWCAAFVGGCLEAVGIVSSRFESARSYEAWGQPLEASAVGAVVVLRRDGGGHVGFEVGRDAAGNVLLLGGNQSNRVSIAAFDPQRVVARRWPLAVPKPEAMAMPRIKGYEMSRGEA